MKNEINQLLSETLLTNEKALSAWLGGSAATSREDQFSDTDIVVISLDADLIFRSIEDALNSRFKINQTWIVEEPSRYKQRFYTIDGSSETYYVDAVVFEQTDPENFQEYFNESRHGTPVVLFDKTGILKEAQKNPHYENPSLNLDNVKAKFEVMYRTFFKEYLRGKYIDAYAFYLRLVTIYVQVERFKHSPQKHDFNLRYLTIDLPAEKSSFIEQLLKVSDLETMKINADKIKQRMESL